MHRPLCCYRLSVLQVTRARTGRACFATIDVDTHRHSEDKNIETIKSKLSNILDPKIRFSIVANEQHFLSIYKEARAANDMQRAYNVAASLINSATVPSGLVWQCALREKIDSEDVSGFLSCYRLMLASQHRLDLEVDSNYYLWQEAIEVFCADQGCTDILFEHARSNVKRRSQIYVFILENIVDHSIENLHETVLFWHSRLLQHNFVPDERAQTQIVKLLSGKLLGRDLITSMSTQFKQAGMEIDLTSVAKQALHQYTGKISRTNSCSSVEELSSEPRSFEHLLRQHVKYSDHATTLAFIESSLATTFELRQRARCTIGFFYGTLGNYDKLFTFCRSQYSAQHSSTEDAFWAATIKGAVKGGRALLPVLQTVESRGARIGSETLGICVELSQNLEESQQFISRMLSENMQVMLRGYAVFIRHVARSGDVRKAQHLLEVALRVSSATSISEKDASHLRRCFMLGLLEGAKYEELEVTHAQWCSQKLDRADTWNLVVRSRTVDRRVQQALEALREMGTRGMHVENATARELMGAVLRLRRPGRNPHVLDASDTRPYLQDIKTAISIGHKCLQSGGRTQPETWHEVMKRLSLYGEFDALEALTDWLIPQYSHVQSKMTIKRYYKYKPEQKLLSQTHAQHPLSRLIRQRDISAITTRGFVNDKPLEALNLIAKWHSMGVPVDAPAVQKRIEVGLKYLLRDLEMPQAFVEQVADKLRPVSKRLEIAHVIQNPLV